MMNIVHGSLCVLLMMSCACYAQPSDEVNHEVVRTIEMYHEQYARSIVQHDVAGIVQQYTSDSWIMVPGLPVHCGPTAAEDFYNTILKPQPIAQARYTTVDVYGIGHTMLAEVGFYQYFDAAGKRFDDGKYMILWKQEGHDWKRFRVSYASSR